MTRIVDEVEHDAPWLVMVHGFSQDHRVFDRQIDAFKSMYRIAAIDLPGHGSKSDAPGPFGHEEYGRSIESEMRAHSIANAHFWGTHTGAAVGLLIACRDPGRIRSLVLEGAIAPGRSLPVVDRLAGAAKTLAVQNGPDAAIEYWWRHSPWFDYMRSHPVECRADMHRTIIGSFSGRPWLDQSTPAPVDGIEEQVSTLGVPALLYNGDHDHPEFLASAATLAATLLNARTQAIPNSGGFPAWERPGAVNDTVRDFLATIEHQEKRDS